jgi:hypothetical protein
VTYVGWATDPTLPYTGYDPCPYCQRPGPRYHYVVAALKPQDPSSTDLRANLPASLLRTMNDAGLYTPYLLLRWPFERHAVIHSLG